MRRACRLGLIAGLGAAILAALPGVAAAQPMPSAADAPSAVFEEALVSGISLLHDNDGWPHPGNSFKDDNYSAGLEIRVNGRVIPRAGLTRPLDGLDWLTRVNRMHARATRRFHSAQVFGLAYTPDVLDTDVPQRDDRPFASLVGLAVRRTSVLGEAGDRAWSSEFAIGVLGLDAARHVQTLLHRTRRWMTGNPTPVDPLGWTNQISDGGEPTALYRVGYERLLAGDGAETARKHWQVTGTLDGSVGYQTNASAAITARAGVFTSEFWEFVSGIRSAGAGRQQPAPGGVPRWDLFAFGLVRPRLVAWNALLQGQFRASEHTVRVKRLIGEWEGGAGASVPMGSWHLQGVVQVAQGRTTEFVAPKARLYTWGTIMLLVSREARGR
ncbi:MAG: lipid A deacylase LpxR family protein [Acidobacteria bacterium]|nr:lipid A deacylase LpxR family protein [Acidobacteriota bacterium]